MKLHLQRSVDIWCAVDMGICPITRKKPLLSRVEEILVKERDDRSKRRTASGFHVTLVPSEEEKLRDLIEPIYGPFGSEKFKSAISDLVDSANLEIRVSYYVAPRGGKKGWQPAFTFVVK